MTILAIDPGTHLGFTVPGVPGAKGRARAFALKGTGKIRMFTPAKTERYESLIRDAFALQVKAEVIPYTGPVEMHVKAYYAIPKSKPKWWKAMAQSETLAVTKKPDMDNIVKVVKDALNNIAYRDDSQVFRDIGEKFYSERPRVEVQIWFFPECVRPTQS